MKFEKIHISGFGALQELEFDGISPGLNIIEGANEAGKTTMLEFVRALFFGFAQRDKSNDDARRYEPKGGAHGGWAILQNSHNETLRIERIGDKTSAGDVKVQLLGTDRDLNIDALLNGADRMLYEQIFAFSLDELTDFSSSDQRVQNRIYAASSGKQGEFLINALKRTGESADKLYLKGGRKPQLNKALAEYRNLQSQIKELSGQVEEYNSDRDQFLEHQQNAEELRGEFISLKKLLDSAKLHATVWETWVRLSALRNELNELPAQAELDVAKAASMPDLKIKLQQQQDAIEEKLPRLKRVEEELNDCDLEVAILQNGVAIKALKEQLGTYESTLGELPLAKQNLESIDQGIKVLLEQLGPRWNEAEVEKIDTSREPRLQIQQRKNSLEVNENRIEDAAQKESATAQQVMQQEQSLKRLQLDIQKEFPAAPPEQTELKARDKALQESDLLLRKVETHKLRAEFLQKEIAEKQRQQYNVQQNKKPNEALTWAYVIPPIFSILVGFIFWSQQSLSPLIALVLIIFGAVFSAVLRSLTKNSLNLIEEERQRYQEAADEITELQKKIQSCADQIKVANSTCQEIGRPFGWDLQNHQDHQKYSEELARDREKRSRYENLHDDVKRRSGDLEAIREIQKAQNENIDSLKSTFKEQQNEWKEWLETCHLPVETSPQQTLELFDFIEKVREQFRDRNQYQLVIAAKQKQCKDFENTANKLWQELQREAPEKNQLPGAVRALSDELEKQQALEIKRKNLLENQQQLQDELETQTGRRQEVEKQIEQILTETDCVDQQQFDIKVNIANKRDELQKHCQEQERILETHSAPGDARLKLESDLKDLDAQCVSEQFATAQSAYAEVENKMAEAERAQGEWNNKIQQRENEEGKLTALLRQLEVQKSTIADATQQWATARLTNLLLDCTRERFEQERQPAVIKRAGELMSGVTAGRYQSVLASSLDKVELDEGEHGRKPLSRWSRGTKEQFYLSLRLAFIEDYCSQEHLEPLPVVMDDVLVHSDGYNRLAAASAMIAKFAEKYQVLYFTCRPGDAEVLFTASPNVRRFKLQEKSIAVI